MKYSLCIATIICVFLGYSTCIDASNKNNQQIPTVGKIANEYLVQNTVKFANANGIFQTKIDKNPGKYQIINGLSAKEDKSDVLPPIYDKDSAPYYDPTRPQPRRIGKIPNQQVALNRYTNQIYPLDKLPYYGPTKPYRPIVNGGGDHFAVPSKIGNLEERVANQKNINELKKQLNKLNEWIEGPKYMTQDTKGREVYFKDAKAYYDPTMMDKVAKKAQLQKQIRELTQEMNQPEKPTLIIGTKKSSVSIQNFVNTNKEETNEFIANSYYYPVDRSTLVKKPNTVKTRIEANNLKKEQPLKKNEAINIYTKKPEMIKIGSTNKYYDNNKNTFVEAESSGIKIDKRFYYEDKKPAINNNNNNVQTANKAPNTQGLKTAGFRIVSLRKGN